MFGFRERRRNNWRAQPFPEEWLAILQRNVPYYRRLSEQDQQEIRGHVQVLINEKNFEGCGGLALTDEIKVTIAAHAAILLLHRKPDYYPRLDSILVYPNSFINPNATEELGPLVLEGEETCAGEAWQQGVVILAWDEVRRSIRNERDGYNVALHEFAHQLDNENGEDDGIPLLHDDALAERWPQVFQMAFDQLLEDLDHERRTFFDEYAAESPAEFFAVATETFFERPREFKRHYPDLYDVLAQFFQQDPVAEFARQSAEE